MKWTEIKIQSLFHFSGKNLTPVSYLIRGDQTPESEFFDSDSTPIPKSLILAPAPVHVLAHGLAARAYAS